MREYYEKFLRDHICTTCGGSRLNEYALAVKIDNKNIFEVTSMQLKDLRDWIISLNNKLNQKRS
jgi:excinuclease ABC subunit A